MKTRLSTENTTCHNLFYLNFSWCNHKCLQEKSWKNTLLKINRFRFIWNIFNQAKGSSKEINLQRYLKPKDQFLFSCWQELSFQSHFPPPVKPPLPLAPPAHIPHIIIFRKLLTFNFCAFVVLFCLFWIGGVTSSYNFILV